MAHVGVPEAGRGVEVAAPSASKPDVLPARSRTRAADVAHVGERMPEAGLFGALIPDQATRVGLDQLVNLRCRAAVVLTWRVSDAVMWPAARSHVGRAGGGESGADPARVRGLWPPGRSWCAAGAVLERVRFESVDEARAAAACSGEVLRPGRLRGAERGGVEVVVVGGFCERGEDGRVYNSCAL